MFLLSDQALYVLHDFDFLDFLPAFLLVVLHHLLELFLLLLHSFHFSFILVFQLVFLIFDGLHFVFETQIPVFDVVLLFIHHFQFFP